ncbi:Ig-like domain-containing protein [Streptomyces sp. NPDC059247]|uniref:L,D-transpeptidase n=1 Tax=Streptomyces sp. NPDC059247 TaxID=3346790 RepID=UPI0036BB0E74
MKHTFVRRRSTRLAVVAAVLAPLALTACASGDPVAEPDGKAAATTKAAGPAATVAVTPSGTGTRAGTPVKVTARGGTLTSVTVTDGEGRKLKGTLSAKDTVWTSERPAAPGETYRVSAGTRGDGGTPGTQETSFSTARADKVNKLEMWPTERTVGIAHPVSVIFDDPVTNKAAVEKALKVTTDNGTEGAWGWIKHHDGRERVDWRPREYWKAGTKVRLEALLDGVDSGATGGLFARDYDLSFTVGAAQVVEVDLDRKRLDFQRDGKSVRKIPVSGGDPTHGDKASWSGTQVLMRKAGTVRMTSQSVGLGDAYDKDVAYSMHLTWSGAYAHAAPWNAAYFGKANKSSGCIGMSTANAASLYRDVQVGDPFTVTGKDTKGLPPQGNGYSNWNLPWQEWRKLSALS